MLALLARFRDAASEEERAPLRTALAEAYWAAAAEGQVVAHALADELWAECAAAEGLPSAAAAHEAMRRDEAMRRVRSVAACMFERGWDDGMALRALRTSLHAAVEEAPNAAMVENVALASRGMPSIRYARVPADAEACGFCFMISSRGFDLKPGAEKRHNHPNCRCRAVPGFKGRTTVEGYDFEAMRERWKRCRETVGSGDTEAIIAECETRDPRWLWFGEEPEIDYSLQPRESFGTLVKPGDYSSENIIGKGNEWRDLFAHDMLKANGYPLATRPTKAMSSSGRIMDGVTNPDLEIGGFLYEVKSPRDGKSRPKPGNELAFIQDSMKSARHNFSNPYDYRSKKGMGDRRDDARVVLSTRYRTTEWTTAAFEERLLFEMRQYGIREVIWVDEEGSVRKYKSG